MSKKHRSPQHLPQPQNQTKAVGQQVQSAPDPAPSVSYTGWTIQSYHAPLPPPGELAEYEKIVPGISKTLVDQMVAQGKHRMEQERRVIDGNIRAQARAPIYGLIISLGTLTSGTLIALHGEIWPGIIEGLSPTLIILASRIFSERKQAADLRAKRGDLKRRISSGSD